MSLTSTPSAAGIPKMSVLSARKARMRYFMTLAFTLLPPLLTVFFLYFVWGFLQLNQFYVIFLFTLTLIFPGYMQINIINLTKT